MIVMDERVAGRPEVITKGVLVRVRPRSDREAEVEDLLDAVLRLSTREQHTETSFLMRFADGAYALLDLFTDERSRREHLAGAARQAVAYRARDLFDGTPTDALLDVVGHDLPTVAGRARLATGTWLTFDAGVQPGDPDPDPDPGDGGSELRFSASPDAAWLAVRTEGGTLAVIDLAATFDGPEPTRLPEVCRGGREVRLLSSDRFRLIGPDVPEPEVTLIGTDPEWVLERHGQHRSPHQPRSLA